MNEENETVQQSPGREASEMSDLLPCPFCGFAASLIREKNPTKKIGLRVHVCCDVCDARSGSYSCNPKFLHPERIIESAILAWNQRAR